MKIIHIALCLALFGCGAISNIKESGFKSTRTLINKSVFLEPHDPTTKKLYFRYQNPSRANLINRANLEKRFKEKGYTLTPNPKEADYGVEVYIRYFGRVNAKEWVSLASLYDEGNYKFISLDQNGIVLDKQNTRESKRYVGLSALLDLEGLYKRVDFVGIVTGSLTGFLIAGGPHGILVGGLLGGAAFTGASKITEPNNWVILADVVIFESGVNTREYNLQEYEKGITGKAKVEFNKEMQRYEMRTKLVSSVRGIGMSENNAVNVLQEELLYTLSGLV